MPHLRHIQVVAFEEELGEEMMEETLGMQVIAVEGLETGMLVDCGESRLLIGILEETVISVALLSGEKAHHGNH